ncbi:MAG: hypothetical protein DMG07_07050 [Acidobacteria bacterium]|nr:MAG: hypothetical protein DMG07_07050 [Acidobacteriota bacterium]
MALFDTPRVPEAEAGFEPEEVERCASAAALRHLETLDDEMVERALALGVDSGLVLAVGSGCGQIPIKLALGNPSFIIHGLDASDALLRRAALDAARWDVDLRILLNKWEAASLPYDGGLFDLVLCDSLLRRVADPVSLIREMSRVCKPGGALLLRDLLRPNRLALRRHLRTYGRHYEGKMRELFEASVRASYTVRELEALAGRSGVAALEVRRMGPAHLGFERARAR